VHAGHLGITSAEVLVDVNVGVAGILLLERQEPIELPALDVVLVERLQVRLALEGGLSFSFELHEAVLHLEALLQVDCFVLVRKLVLAGQPLEKAETVEEAHEWN
jgi:hypothetical protein